MDTPDEPTIFPVPSDKVITGAKYEAKNEMVTAVNRQGNHSKKLEH